MADCIFKSVTGKRENNEDFYGNYEDEFFVVADGLGGLVAGEVASKIGVETAIEIFKDLKRSSGEADFDLIFKRANEAILKEAGKNPERLGMGTTMLVAQLVKTSLVFANVGDCRAYLFSKDKLEKITSDDRDETGFLIRALGPSDEDFHPRVIKRSAKSGDSVLLCSDGLHDFVRDEVIEKILKSEASLEDKAKGLIDAALQFASTDNITVGLVQV